MAKYKAVITGADGLLGRHMQAAMHAHNGAARFKGNDDQWSIQAVNRNQFASDEQLTRVLTDADVVLHFAGINRADDNELEFGNIDIASRLANVLNQCAPKAHVLYANSTHAEKDIPYGRGKSGAAKVLSNHALNNSSKFSNVTLPHIFGEYAKPFYNNVTATLCHQIINGESPTINDGGVVELLHAGEVADLMIDLFLTGGNGAERLHGKEISVKDLYDKLVGYNEARSADLFPPLASKLDVALFQCLQTAGFPEAFHTELKQNVDERGTLFEAAKGGRDGQTFLSWTKPGVERGNHFHRYKVERFVVVHGSATIKMRHVLNNEIHVFKVNGETPVAVDMPALYTHNIVNTGESPLLTMFWAHEIFNPNSPDTWACPVSIENSQEIIELS